MVYTYMVERVMEYGGVQEEGSIVPVMDCAARSHTPIASGMLSRLLSGSDPLPSSHTAACLRLFGHMTVMCTAFSSPAHFLSMLQSVNALEDLVERGTGREQLEAALRDCVLYLHCLECHAHRYIVHSTASATPDELAKSLVAHLPILVGHLDPLESLLSMLSGSSGRQQSCAGHMTRLSLHVHWTVLSVLYRLAPTAGWRDFLRQARCCLASLLSHAASLSPPGTALSGLAVCRCAQDLWLLLRYTLDGAADATTNPANSFWAMVSGLLSEALPPCQPRPSDDEGHEGMVAISPSDAVWFSWQCVGQLAELYCLTETGGHVDVRREGLGQCRANWELIHHLLPLTFRQGSSEVQLRSCLRVCVSLSRLWPPSLLPVTSAWDYYHRHMDDPFMTAARRTINEWAIPEGSSPRQWLQYMKSLFHSTGAQSHSHTAALEPRPPDEATSFELFLCLIGATMATGSGGGEGGLSWRQLKGRFYSKLHRRWLSERKGAGLHRVLSLLVTLAWTGDPQEVALKTVSLLSQVGLGEPQEHTRLLWRAIFTLLLVLEEREESLEEVITKLRPLLISLAKPRPPESRDFQWGAVGVVLDGTAELLESAKGVSLGAGLLISSHLSDLLTSAEGVHMTRVLGFVESLCTALTPPALLPSPAHMTACDLLLQHCSQQLVTLSQYPLPPSSLPSCLAALTALACQPHSPQDLPPHAILLEVTKDTVDPTLAALYLSHVIASDIIRHHVLTTDHAQALALHTWLRCLAQLDHTPPATSSATAARSGASHAHSTAEGQLTSQLPLLPIVTALLGNQATPTDPMSMLQRLMVAMETAHRKEEGGGEWRSTLHTVLGDLPLYLEPSVAGRRGPDAVRHAYRVAGVVVSRCPRLTYSRSDSRCLLPRMVDRLALPLASPRKPLPEGTTAAIHSQLHLFLSGLLQLEPSQDAFILRKVKQLFSRYFHDCCQPPSPLIPHSPNPFLLALRPWFQEGCHDDREQLALMMEVIASQCLCLPQQPSSLCPTLQFIKSVVEKVQSPLLLVSMAPPLLGHMTSCLLECEVCPAGREHIRRLVMSILRPVVRACREHPDLLPCSSLLPQLRTFVASNTEQLLVVQPLMTLWDLYPDLVQQLVLLLGNDETLQSIGHTLQDRLVLAKADI